MQGSVSNPKKKEETTVTVKLHIAVHTESIKINNPKNYTADTSHPTVDHL